MTLPRPALIVLFGSGLGIAAPVAVPLAAQTLPRLGLSGPEVGMDLSAKSLGGGRAGHPEADAVIRQPRGAGRSRTLVRGRAEEIGRDAAPEAGEDGWPVDPPRSARAEP